MYKFPDNFDGSSFLGRKLEMVCFTANQFFLHFGTKFFVGVESSVVRSKVGRLSGEKLSVSEKLSLITDLLERRVVDASISQREVLKLVFETGDILTFSDVSENFESYHFNLGAEEFVI